MVKKNGEAKILRCSFCNRDQNDVQKLIAGPTVFICNDCVDVCTDIIADDKFVAAQSRQPPTRTDLARRAGRQTQQLTHWLSGVEGVEIDHGLADFAVACGRNAVIDLWSECQAVVTRLDASGTTASGLPLDLRTRMSRLASLAQGLGLVVERRSCFASDDESI